jgi:hypothetical protein
MAGTVAVPGPSVQAQAAGGEDRCRRGPAWHRSAA